MSTPPNDSQQSFTSQDIDAWLLTAQERCAALHMKAATSYNSIKHHEAFAGMSALLQQALEKVHMLNTHIRKMMPTACDRATAVQRHVTPITEASRKWGERRDGYILPPLRRYRKPRAGCWRCSEVGTGKRWGFPVQRVWHKSGTYPSP